MLSFFPKPYEDELLYSIIARYHVWSGNGEISDTMDQLFDNRRERATLMIPKHLRCLTNKTKKFGVDYDTLLFRHTIFPFITCFLNKESYNAALASLDNINQVGSSLFIYKHNLFPKYLRYCPLCLREDRHKYGEGYWHRIHQTYGLNLCALHGC